MEQLLSGSPSGFQRIYKVYERSYYALGFKSTDELRTELLKCPVKYQYEFAIEVYPQSEVSEYSFDRKFPITFLPR
jgi:hypothetical protein